MLLPSFLKLNKEKISSIQEPQFKINKAYYEYQYDDRVRAVIESCSNGYINRTQVTEFFINEDYETGFFAAMIWGGISVGGVMGNNLIKLLEVPSSRLNDVIANASKFIANNEFKSAYEYMETKGKGKLSGLGDSFFTKLFFFLAHGRQQQIVPPIFDKWTKLAYIALLKELNHVQELNQFVTSMNLPIIRFRGSQRSTAFEDYVLKMNQWATDLNVDVSTLETFVFGTDLRKDRTNSNPRVIFQQMLTEDSKAA